MHDPRFGASSKNGAQVCLGNPMCDAGGAWKSFRLVVDIGKPHVVLWFTLDTRFASGLNSQVVKQGSC